MKIYCEDCDWYSNAWGHFDCYHDNNNIYFDSKEIFGVAGIKKHNWEINKNHDCEWFEPDRNNTDLRDLLKRCKKYDKNFKIGGHIINGKK